MKTIIQTPGFKAQQKLIDFVQEQMNKFDELSDRIIESRVLLKIDNADDRKNKVCEVRLVIPGNDLFASRQEETFEQALMQVIPALKQQVVRRKPSEQRLSRSQKNQMD